MANKYFEGTVRNTNVVEDADEELINLVNELDKNVENKMDNLEIGNALDAIFDVLRRTNKYIDETTPWSLAKEEDKKDRLETVIYNLLDSIRVCTYNLQAFLPDTAKEICRQLGIDDPKNKVETYNVTTPTPLFQRIEVDKNNK